MELKARQVYASLATQRFTTQLGTGVPLATYVALLSEGLGIC